MRRFWPLFGSPQPRVVLLAGNFTVTSDVVSAETGKRISGASVALVATETGRFRVTFDTNYRRILASGCSMVGPTDSAFPTTTGSSPKVRNQGTAAFDVQFIREDTQADAAPADGTVGNWWAIVSTI